VTGPTEKEGGAVASPASMPAAESERADLARSPSVDRSAALAEGAPGIPARFVWWVLGAALVLSLGGFLGERLFSSAGLNPAPTTTTTAPNPVQTAPPDTPAPPAPARALDAPLASFMGLSTPSPRLVTPFALTDQNGQTVTVPIPSPRVVVLTFFNAPCNDICPVLAAELQQADADLGAQANDVEFVTVNTDPAALAQSAEGPAVSGTALGSLTNWHMVTGPLTTLNQVWKAYGVSISLNAKTGLEAHTDVMDFIDPQGFLRYRSTPFADESSLGSFSLPSASEARWGQGIAMYARKLIAQ
jgi:cytochrome oxidase Cu insertion factor (SCO1/SenC/PrrC family)